MVLVFLVCLLLASVCHSSEPNVSSNDLERDDYNIDYVEQAQKLWKYISPDIDPSIKQDSKLTTVSFDFLFFSWFFLNKF